MVLMENEGFQTLKIAWGPFGEQDLLGASLQVLYDGPNSLNASEHVHDIKPYRNALQPCMRIAQSTRRPNTACPFELWITFGTIYPNTISIQFGSFQNYIILNAKN